MNELYFSLLNLQEPALLATIVQVVGSTYRHEGAKLLITAGGASIGMISGGCLEDDVREQGQPTLLSGVPALVTYDMRGEDDGLWGLNLGCNGLVQLFVERVDPQFYGALATEWKAGRPCARLVVISPGERQGALMLLRADGSVLGEDVVGPEALEQAAACLAGGKSSRILCKGDLDLFIDVITPPPILWVVGAGADAPALVQAATGAGWRVHVVDRRSQYADPGRFPQAAQVLRLEPNELVAMAGVGAYAVCMHHHFDHDREYLAALIEASPRYLGVLGPLRRTQRMLGREELPPFLYAPIGLDLGGDGPAGVAISIVAEVQAVRSGRMGGHLRGSAAPIHRRE